MPLENCTSYWYRDDFTSCGRHVLIEQNLFGSFLIGTVIVLGIQIILHLSSIDSVKLDYKPGTENEPLLEENNSRAGYVLPKEDSADPSSSSSSSIDRDISKAARKHFDITRIKPVKSDGTPLGHIQVVFRDGFERTKVVVEFLLLIAHLCLAIIPVHYAGYAEEWSRFPTIPYLGVAYWCFALLICLIRISHLSTGLSHKLPNLWWYTFTMYLLDWLPSAALLRSALLNHTANLSSKKFYIWQFALDTALAFVAGFERYSDRPAILLKQDNIEPSPEEKTPFFSIATYSWIDTMIFTAREKAISMLDIWGLRFDDYAYPVLMSFHKTIKYHRFTFDLFNQFKTYLFLQACYTSVEGFIVFVPAVLLKRILEYVDAPDVVPSSLAWLFVLLMLVSGVITSVIDGRGLFIGRRVCTRMKAIIIGEIYAKALRRRQTADTQDEPAESKDEHISIDGAKGQENEEVTVKVKDPSAVKSKDLGSIINLMAVDAFKVSEICGYLHYFVNSLVMTGFAIYLLYELLGWPALAGAVTIVLLLPVNYKMSMRLGKFQNDMLKVTDKRIQKLNETFQSIRIIKFFSWEEKFEEDIMKIRQAELFCLLQKCIAWAVASFVWMVTPTLVCLVAFYCYTIVLHKPLTTPIAFTALSLFNLLREPLDQFADMLSAVVQSKVSLDRIEDFLREPECSKYEQLDVKRGPNSPLVGFENATFSWSKHSKNDFKLRDINISFKTGKLNVIIGATGAGKSSVLLALLGEMDLLRGKVFLPGSTPREDLVPNPVTGLTESVAFCAQTPWLLNATIRENIVFASPFDRVRYDSVIHACGLERDLEILNGGDETEIGEKGVTLSGGQKQRVSLARALYSHAAYVLLDDCLSAVDSHTAVLVYEKCITGELMRNRTCILVSHNISLTIREASWVVSMENGRVKAQGTVDELMNENLFDSETVTSVMASRSNSSVHVNELKSEASMHPDPDHNLMLTRTKSALQIDRKSQVMDHNRRMEDESCGDEEEEEERDNENVAAGKLVKEETKSEGAVSLSVYKTYFRFFGTWKLWFLMLLAFIGSQAVYVFQSYWLRIWSMAESQKVEAAITASYHNIFIHASDRTIRLFRSVDWNRPFFQTSISESIYGAKVHSSIYYIAVYTLIGALYSSLGCLRIVITFFCNLRVSKEIFKLLLDRVMRAKIRFFDSTPIGRIMNRFSRDIEGVDQELGPYTEAAIVTFISCVATIIVITLITPAFLIFAIFIMLLYMQVGVSYLTLSRDLKRYESITRSPIHQHFTETLVGVTTIRAYCDETRFLVENMQRIDRNNRPFFYVWVNNRWLAMRADMIGCMVTFLSAALAVYSARHIDSGMAGISLSFAVSFSDGALWLLRTYANVEINMNSVERIQEYIENTEQEPAAYTKQDPPSSWPQRGEIEVHDLSIKYAPQLPRVINEISFNVGAAQKIGVVGRTGAGKSTIIQSFFRFVEPDSGYIKIDGVNISDIGLTPLRRGLTIIPQDPTLFAGTLRSNLDIYDQYSDMSMYQSLKRVNLITNEDFAKISNTGFQYQSQVGDTSDEHENINKFLDLDSEITEGGGNLSQGERQLICLARALLKSPKILMLDEATASIDYESDAKLQKTIRDEFSSSTIITIAHRLKTIIDYDRILVLDAGQIKQYDHPYKLITQNDSQFRSMCEDTGEFDELVKLSKAAYGKQQAKSKA